MEEKKGTAWLREQKKLEREQRKKDMNSGILKSKDRRVKKIEISKEKNIKKIDKVEKKFKKRIDKKIDNLENKIDKVKREKTKQKVKNEIENTIEKKNERLDEYGNRKKIVDMKFNLKKELVYL